MIKRRSKYARLCLVCKARQAKQQKVKRARSRLNEQRKQVSAGTYFWSNQDLSRRRVVPRYATCVWVVGSSFFLSFFPSYRRHINYLHCIALHLRCLALLLLSPIISLPLSFSLTLSLSLTHSLSLTLSHSHSLSCAAFLPFFANTRRNLYRLPLLLDRHKTVRVPALCVKAHSSHGDPSITLVKTGSQSARHRGTSIIHYHPESLFRLNHSSSINLDIIDFRLCLFL